VKFVTLGRDDTPATTGRRPQGMINQAIDRLSAAPAGVDTSHRAKLDRSRSRVARRIATAGEREFFTLDPGAVA
jgi:hypothetical protein